ncbi:membrane protein [Oenococcus oeni]|uniref:membrane protein n=1 Tax=Oenococcus oeni TaxID=1247 RepID=UPI00050E4528|nr:membrane protein [Oenococcus oeni]KGH81230.1 membrane protein [Oenococcus oeni S14]
MKKIKPAFLPAILILCLLIGSIGNLTSVLGVPALLVVVLLGAGLYFGAPRLDHLSTRQLRWGIGLGLLAMLIAQVVVLHVMPNTVYHDPYRVLSQADQLAAGHMTWDITYFWRYANNVPLAYLLSLWLRLTQLVGLSTNLSVHLLSILVLDSFIALALHTIWQLSQRASLLVVAFGFFALSPFAYTYYLQVFYSDLPTMLVLLIIIRSLLNWSQKTSRQRWFAGSGLVVAVMLGAMLKPNLVVLLPALLIVGLILARQHLWRQAKLTLPILLIVLGFGLSLPATKVIDVAANYQPRTAFSFPATNWILMGYNQHSNGGYSGKDVGRAIKQPSQAARQRYNLKTIPKRIKTLGVVGVIRLWVVKLGIVLNVQGIQRWYNGGFRAAPSWYSNHAGFYQGLTVIGYVAATPLMWGALMLKLLRWRPDLTDPHQILALLAVTTALGYLAFHTLLWEVEPRYGQAILPLLWVALAAIPRQASQSRPRWANQASLLNGATALLVAFGAAGVLGAQLPQKQVIAAQRSQLSVQYHAKPKTVTPGTVLAEVVDVNAPANYFSVQIHAGSQVQVTLTNLATGQHYRLTMAGSVARLHHQLAAGQYRITVQNLTTRGQQVDVTHTYHYQLAAHPLTVNGQSQPTASLIYTCMQR